MSLSLTKLIWQLIFHFCYFTRDVKQTIDFLPEFLYTIFWNSRPYWTLSLLQDLCQVDRWDRDIFFPIYIKATPPILAFEPELGVVQWPILNKPVLVRACLRVFFSQAGIVEGATALWGLIEHIKSKCGKMWIRKTLNTDTLYSVSVIDYL